MKLILSNNIVVKEPTQAVRLFCKNRLVIDNPDYITRERLGKWTGTIPRYLHLYEENSGDLILPFGCRRNAEFLEIVKGCSVTWTEYKPERDFRADFQSSINLYPYQENAVKAMLAARNGVVVMPCGSGKTQTALECVARLGLKTLWLTHTQDLLKQSMERAKACFGCDNDSYGTITEGKIDIGKNITFATVQTMQKLDFPRYRKEWAVIVVDECQHCCGSPTKVSQFYRVLSNLYAPYKFGLTATPHRADGLDKSMYALLGDIIIAIPRKEVEHMTCPVEVKIINTEYEPDIDFITNGDGTINYSGLVVDIINSKQRFDKVISVINEQCKSYAIVLANRVQYLQDLQKKYTGKSVCISAVKSKKEKEERANALKMLNSGEIDCIFATYKLAAEGLDCPNLKYVVFATPEKDERTIIQAIGRAARKAKGKECGTVIDLVDEFGMYKNWAKKRQTYYKKLKCSIKY